jgi:hypothetical protein
MFFSSLSKSFYKSEAAEYHLHRTRLSAAFRHITLCYILAQRWQGFKHVLPAGAGPRTGEASHEESHENAPVFFNAGAQAGLSRKR